MAAATKPGRDRRSWRIVPLSHDTMALLDRVENEVFDAPIRPDALAAFLDDSRHVMMLAEAEGRVVGMASGSELLHPDKAPQLFINEVGVAPGWRRRGIARALVAGLVEVARVRGCDYVWLGTETDNEGGNACFGSVPGVENGGTFVLYEWAFDRN